MGHRGPWPGPTCPLCWGVSAAELPLALYRLFLRWPPRPCGPDRALVCPHWTSQAPGCCSPHSILPRGMSTVLQAGHSVNGQRDRIFYFTSVTCNVLMEATLGLFTLKPWRWTPAKVRALRLLPCQVRDCLCLCLYLPVSPSLCLSVYFYVSMSLCLCVCLYLCLSLSLYLCPCVSASVPVSVPLCLCLRTLALPRT